MACAALLEWMSEFRAYLIIPSIGAGGHTSRLVYAFRRQVELHNGGGEDMQVIKSLFARREQRDRVRSSNRGRRDKTLRGEVFGGFRARYGLRFVKGLRRELSPGPQTLACWRQLRYHYVPTLRRQRATPRPDRWLSYAAIRTPKTHPPRQGGCQRFRDAQEAGG